MSRVTSIDRVKIVYAIYAKNNKYDCPSSGMMLDANYKNADNALPNQTPYVCRGIFLSPEDKPSHKKPF